MATTSRFDDMLRAYAPNKIFREDLIKQDWFLSNVERDDSWVSDELEVRFQGSRASSVKFGSLTDEDDIGQSTYVKGMIESQPEVWGSLIFNEKDLMRNGKLSEQNFLKLLPGEIEDFQNFMRMALSLSFTNGPRIAVVTDDTDADSGVLVVDRVERFEIDQAVRLGDSAASPHYITSINIDGDSIVVSETRGGSAADVSTAVGADPDIYLDGGETASNRLTSLKQSLLSYANSGLEELYGVTKTDYPFTQSINIDGSGYKEEGFLTSLFDAQTLVRRKGKGNANTLVMSFKHLGTILKALENSKGAYRQADEKRAELFGWTEITIVGVKGMMKVVGIQEMDDDWIAILDMSALKVYSNGFIKKRVSPEGHLYHVIRTTSGYKYIVDLCFFGDMVLERPSRCGIIHSISY